MTTAILLCLAGLVGLALGGELLVRGSHQGGTGGGAASFNALQQRLGRKTVSKKMLAEAPAFVRLYDALTIEGEDLRALPWSDRRRQLEKFGFLYRDLRPGHRRYIATEWRHGQHRRVPDMLLLPCYY